MATTGSHPSSPGKKTAIRLDRVATVKTGDSKTVEALETSRTKPLVGRPESKSAIPRLKAQRKSAAEVTAWTIANAKKNDLDGIHVRTGRDMSARAVWMGRSDSPEPAGVGTFIVTMPPNRGVDRLLILVASSLHPSPCGVSFLIPET